MKLGGWVGRRLRFEAGGASGIGFVRIALAMLIVLVVSCKRDAQISSETSEPAASIEPTVSVLLAYGSEKKSWLVDAIQRFNDSAVHLPNGPRIKVVGQAVGSGAAFDDLVDGTTRAQAWAPASSMYRDWLNDAWTARQGAAGGKKELTDEGKSLALSPVVLAMWKPMAQALGWPAKPVGWSDVLTLAKDPKGWASKGHPEWGAFKFGHTHPGFSNSGSLAVLAAIYGATNQVRGMTSEMLDKPEVGNFLGAIEQSVVHYGKSTGFFADKMLTRGPEFLSAAVLYENLVVDSYTRPEYKNRDLDLVAIYPKEGTFWIDNPFYVLDAPWSDDAQRQAAGVFRDFLLSAPEQARAMTSFGFRPSDPKIAITAPIDAEHGVDPKQPQTLLEIPPTNLVVKSLALWSKVKKVVDIVFVFDHSGSMSGDPLKQAKQGALDFIAQLDDRDRVSLLLFNDGVPPVVEPGELGLQRQQLNETLSNTFAAGGTALYDAISQAHTKLHQVATQSPNHIFALVVLTDGKDEHSESTLEQLQQKLQQPAESLAQAGSEVRIFTIAYGDGADTKLLADLAERGSGASFTGDTKSIRQVYRDLAAFF